MELGSRMTLSNTRVADLALGDPGLALQLLRVANLQAHERRELEVSSVSHAVMLLGMEQTLAVVARLRTVESIQPRTRRDGLLHALGRAAHAMGLTREWTRQRKGAAGESAVCATILKHAAELAVWSGHAQAQTIFASLFAAGDERSALEIELLGTTLSALAERLANEAHLPASLCAVLDDSAALQPRLLPSVLASTLAEAAARDWYHPRTLELIGMHGELHNLQPGQASGWVHAATARVARGSPFGSAISAARYLLLAPGMHYEAEETMPAAVTPAAGEQPPAAAKRIARQPGRVSQSSQPVITTLSAAQTPRRGDPAVQSRAPAATSTTDEDAFRRCLGLLLEQRRGRATVQQVLPGVVDALREGLGFDRAAFALISREKQCLRARYTSGQPSGPALEVDISRTHLITRLLESPQGLWLHAANRQRLWPYLPRTLRAYAGERSLCAMSLFVRERPVGLLYADYDGNEVDERCYSRFKQIALELARALTPVGR